MKYCASIVLSTLNLKANTEELDFFYSKIKEINSKKHKLEFNILANALEEKNNLNNHKNIPCSLFLDSGGLQLVSRKEYMNLSEEEKQKLMTEVFYTQTKYGDYNMSFDEIPRIKLNEANTHSLIKFGIIEDKFFECGLNSSYHLQKQIEIFEKEKAKGKILAIIQGSNQQLINDYFNGLKQKADIYNNYVGGIAVAGGGNGTFAYLHHTYSIMKNNELIPLRKKLVHYLGVAGIKRLASLWVLEQNNIIDFPISVDASSIMILIIKNGYFFYKKNNKLIEYHSEGYGKITPQAKEYLEYIYESTPLKNQFNHFEDIIKYSSFYPAKNFDNKEDLSIRRKVISYERMMSLFNHFENLRKQYDEGNYEQYFQKDERKIIKLIQNVKDIDELEYILNKVEDKNIYLKSTDKINNIFDF